MQPREIQRFRILYGKVRNYVNRLCEEGMPHKSYEGAMSLSVEMPDVFDDGPPSYCLKLDCYLLCPGRHATWRGFDLSALLDSAERDVAAWMNDQYGDETDELVK